MPRSTMWHDGVKITATSRGSGLMGALVALAVAVLVLRLLYGVAESVLVGLRESAAVANTLVAGAFALVMVLAVVGGLWWLVVGRRRAAAQDEVAAEHARAVSADVAARQIERARQRQVEARLARELERGSRARTDVATGPDALPWDREPVELDRGWSA